MKRTKYPQARIMIVDDSPVDARLLQDALEAAGFVHIEALHDSRLVISHCENTDYDLILLDLNMPFVDGFQILSQLAELRSQNYLSVLVITALNDRESRIRVLELGAKDIITKPWDVGELLNRIDNLLEVRVLHKKILQQNKLLEQRVSERTRKLQEANQRLLEEIEVRKHTEVALEMARDKALDASQLKSQFLANMSHEIRTPLNGILGMLSLLVNSGASGEIEEYAQVALKSGEVLLALINDILDFSKVESGHIELESISYDLRQLVDEVIALLDKQATQKGLDLYSLLGPDVPAALVGDPARLRQILTNLVGNALKFTPQGEIGVRVNVVQSRGRKVSLRFEVRDTGVGIPGAAQARIFESFTQADGSTTRRFGGTGLGLAICKQLVELMGGEIGVESEEGKGSRFWFEVPQTIDTAGRALFSPVSLKGLRMLVAGHGGPSIPALRVHLANLGVRFVQVDDIKGILPTLEEASDRGEPFDLLFIDFDSFDEVDADLVRSIKKRPVFSSLKVIALAASGLRGDARLAREAGFSAYLTETLDEQSLLTCVTTVMVSAEKGLVTRHSLAEQAAQYKARVLVAEDNPVNQKVAAKMLAKLGVRADIVDNGAAAVKAVEAKEYDLVLMDCLMPELDGYGATERIRRHEALAAGEQRHVPIVAMTANVLKQDIEKCVACGMDDFVAKPVKLETVAALLAKWLGDKRHVPERVGE